MPEIVKDGAEFKSVDYSAIIPILIKAVQELINK